MKLKNSSLQAPILHHPNPSKKYIVYRDASVDTWKAQLTQEHNGMEFPMTFLSHTFLEAQRKWSTTEKDAYGVYYAIPNGTTIFKAQASLSGMTTSHLQNF